MNILWWSRFLDSYGLVQKVAKKHNVTVYCDDKKYRNKGKGIDRPKRTDFYEPYLDKKKTDLIVFDMSGKGKLADSFRKMGFLTVGGGEIADKLEDDRRFAMDAVKKYCKGVKVPEYREFKGIKDGLKFLEGEDEPYVFKPNHLPTAWTYVPRKDDNEALKNVMRACPDQNAEYVLSKKVRGVEVSQEGWFNGEDFVPGMWNRTMEDKRFLNGDWGPNCGCAGSVIWAIPDDDKLCGMLHRPITDFLREKGHVGPVDFNCIVDGEDVYFLEFTCFDDQTEVLTTDGFKSFADLTLDDLVGTLNPKTHKLEYQYPVGILSKHHKGEMRRFVGGGKMPHFDILVTPDHQMYVDKKGSKGWEFVRADKMPTGGTRIKKSCQWDGVEADSFTIPAYTETHCSGRHMVWYPIYHPEIKVPMDVWLKFVGIYLAEGSLGASKNGKRYQVSIAQRKDSGVRQVAELLRDFPIPFTYGAGKFVASSIQLADFIDKYLPGKCDVKRVPSALKMLSARQIDVLLDAFIVGDGHVSKKNGQRSCFTTSKGLADDLQELFLKIGTTADIKHMKTKGTEMSIDGNAYVRNHDIYILAERKVKKDPVIFGRHIKTEPYDGMVYCAEVPNHILCTRRNGTVTFNGNCRFGYEGIQNISLLTDDIGETLYKIAKKEEPEPLKDGFSLSVRVSMPPYPLTEDDPDPAKSFKGVKVLDVPEELDDFVMMVDVMKNDEGEMVLAGIDGVVASVHAVADSVPEAMEEAYSIIEEIAITSDLQFRTDIGEGVEEDIEELADNGWFE